MFRKRLFALLAAVGTATAVITTGAPPANAAIVSLSDVSAAVSAQATAFEDFPATATIKNTGLLTQPAGSTLTISATGGTLGSLPAGCVASGASAVCTAGQLASGASQPFDVTVTPDVGASSVVTTAVASSALPEINVLPDSANNTASSVTTVAYTVVAGISSDPPTVRNGNDTVLTATVTNTGAPQNATLVVDTGGTFDPTLGLPAACSASGNTVTCTGSFGIGDSFSVDIAVTTPATGPSITSVATATGSNGGSDSSASVTTEMYADATAFVPEPGHIAARFGHVGADLVVQTGSSTGGVFVDSMAEADMTGKNCGTTACAKYAPEVIFRGSGNYRPGDDITKPMRLELTYLADQGPPVTCNGKGKGADCWNGVLYYAHNLIDTPVQMHDCSTPGAISSINDVCLDFVVKLPGGGIKASVLLLRDIVIPIIGGTSGSNG